MNPEAADEFIICNKFEICWTSIIEVNIYLLNNPLLLIKYEQ